MAIDLIDLGPSTPDGGSEGGVKINAMLISKLHKCYD